MGMAKAEYERIQTEGWEPIDESYVCSKCFNDAGLQQFIRNNISRTGCDYCNDNHASRRKSCDINLVIKFISECIREHYEDPAQQVAYESAEGGYLLPTQDTYDLLGDLIDVDDDTVLDAVRSAFDGRLWVQADPYSDLPSDVMFFDWQSFCEFIKHKRRFFVNTKANKIFDDVLRGIKDSNAFTRMKAGTTLFRSRTFHSRTPYPLSFDQISMPPKNVLILQANRMSAAGIPIFYCSDSTQTSILEAKTSNIYKNPHDHVGIASFKTLKSLQVLDLTKVPFAPSIFEKAPFHQRESLIFINRFKRDIMKPVRRDGREHVEYIPSQIFTEYVREFVKYGNRKVDGICYPSSQHPGGRNFAFFVEHKDIADINGSPSGKLALNSAISVEKL